jgi:hypothetical protein
MPEAAVVRARRAKGEEVLGRLGHGLAKDLDLQVAVRRVERDRLRRALRGPKWISHSVKEGRDGAVTACAPWEVERGGWRSSDERGGGADRVR